MTLLLMLPSHNNSTNAKESNTITIFALTMLSDNLVKLYDDVKLPYLTRDKLEKIYSIKTIDDLIESKEISDFANDSSDLLILFHIACYFNERRKTEGMHVQLCPLISESAQFFSYMAKFAISKGINEDEKHSTEEDEHKLQIEDALRKNLKIDSKDSPWRLNSSQTVQYVELKKLPREIRLRVPLFKRLFTHQRSGIEWMTGLFIAKTGGVLADEMGMGKTYQSLSFIFCLFDSRTIRNALVVCPNPILLTTWLSEAMKLLDYFGSDCAIQVDVITSEIGEHERNEILKAAKCW
jgi:SNF2 family DNA or RNA helicase